MKNPTPTSQTAQELARVVQRAVIELGKIEPERARRKPSPEKWSIQEIIGHLLDSAVNNHYRFIRAQEEEVPVFHDYAQEHWVKAQDFNQESWDTLLELWKLYNQHLCHVIERVPASRLNVKCRLDNSQQIALGALIEDYLAHLKHHLEQIHSLTESQRDRWEHS